MIEIKKSSEIKKVTKPWGYELWMADKSNSKFALKKNFYKSPLPIKYTIPRNKGGNLSTYQVEKGSFTIQINL